MKNFKQKLKGYSLAELVLAIGIFAIISSMLVLLVIDSTRTLENTYTRSKATQLTKEVYSTLIMLKSDSWYNVARHTGEGNKYIDFVGGVYEILDGEITNGNLTYYFLIDDVYRDLDRNITTQDLGTLDPHSRLIDIYISWTDRLGKVNTINPKIYVNDWNTNSISWTTQEDFDTGVFAETISLVEGAVSLETASYGDWCRPELSLRYYNLPGQGIASSISTFGESVIMGTGGNASGLPFIKAIVTEEPPSITIDESFSSSHKVNDVFLINEDYALLATDTGSEEIIIISMNPPVEKVGFFNAEGNQKADTVSAYGNIGFMTERNNLISFDITSPLGSRPQLQTFSLGGQSNQTTATDMYVDENYIYLTLSNHTDAFVVYEYQPTFRKVGQIPLGSSGASALFISEDKTRAFIGTPNNPGHEFFILDITNIESTYSVVFSAELGGMSVNALISADNRVMIGGTGGQQYQVFDLEEVEADKKCGGLTLGFNVNDISLVQTLNNNYSYILTSDSNKELQIIRGGLGGGGADGDGYLDYGQYLSNIFDSGSDLAEYYIMDLKTIIPTGTSLEIQLRVSNSSTMTGSTWIGPDGTSNTYYSDTGIYDLPLSLVGRYFQYKVIFRSDTISTPLLEEIIINYEK